MNNLHLISSKNAQSETILLKKSAVDKSKVLS